MAIKHFFSSGHLLKELNATTITLIPKSKNASSLHDYRPISCCGTIYKCISKVIALRIKNVLPSLIDRAQSAFIPRRRINDNVLLAQELMRGYHRVDSPPRGAIKVDLKKAFDSVRWDFIMDLLEGLHFPLKMIRWVASCISTPKFSLNINGSLEGFFKSSRGLRQGDPFISLSFCHCYGRALHDHLQDDFLFGTIFLSLEMRTSKNIPPVL